MARLGYPVVPVGLHVWFYTVQLTIASSTRDKRFV
jgi:hypothetical protein